MAERPKQVSCYPSAELEEQIQDAADDLDISVSKWLVEAARQKLQSEASQ